MEFNLHYKSIWSSLDAESVSSLSDMSKDVLEEWIMDNHIKAEELEDERLETEIAELEDELARQRGSAYSSEVAQLLNQVGE